MELSKLHWGCRREACCGSKAAKSGSTFLNYKQTFSLVLMAIVDANYKFIYVDVGAQGRISDAGVFSETLFLDALQHLTLALPEPFPRRKLTERQHIFNYRLSRARRMVENAFGILSSKFCVYKSPIALKTSSV